MQSECVPNKLLGGHHEVDLSEPEHQQRIQAGLKGYAKGKMRLVEVEFYKEGQCLISHSINCRSSRFVIRCGTVQIVAGTIHRYTVDLVDKSDQVTNTCNVKIYTPLRDAPEYSFNCQEASSRVKRDVERKKISKGPKTGAPLELTPEEYGKQEHTDRIQSILLSSGGSNERKYRIVGATQQLVAGTLYTYKLVFTDDPDKRVCKLTSHERPWLKEKNPAEAQKVSFSCPDAPKTRSKRSFCVGCPSGLSPADLLDVEHKERVNKILLAKVILSEAELQQKSPEIMNATSQVVQGSLYTYFVGYADQGSRTVCKLTSWERPWLDGAEAYQYTAECGAPQDSNAIRKRRFKSRSKRGYGSSRVLTAEELQQDEHVNRISKILDSDSGVNPQ